MHHISWSALEKWAKVVFSSVLSADGSLKGRMDVSSRQGHQTGNERWEWWWQEKKRDREKIAGVTASTCFHSSVISKHRRGEERKRNARRKKRTHSHVYRTSYHRKSQKTQGGWGCTVSGQCHVATSLFGSSQHNHILSLCQVLFQNTHSLSLSLK